jgi:hypothetical protein
MKFFPLFMVVLGLSFVLNCKDKNVTNGDKEKESARIFFIDNSNDMDVEEIVGAAENRITCKQIILPPPGILVNVKDYEGREFRLEIDNVTTTEFQLRNAYAEYKDTNGEVYKTLSDLQDVEIYWRDNLQICEFTFGAAQTQLFSQSNTFVTLDSLSIKTLREDD